MDPRKEPAIHRLHRRRHSIKPFCTMTKSELVEVLSLKQTHLMQDDVDASVRIILEAIAKALAQGERVEIRGFGSFAMSHRPARTGRNPKTGEPVAIPAKRVPHFKTGKELRERVQALGAESGTAERQAAA
jgi:integration host factor subunit beta